MSQPRYCGPAAAAGGWRPLAYLLMDFMLATLLLGLSVDCSVDARSSGGGGGGGGGGGSASVSFYPPVHVGESNWSHFWMPSSLFRGVGKDILMSVDLAGDGKPCPPPGHPQNCSALYRSRDLGASWAPIYGNIPGMALPIPQPKSPGKTRAYNFASKPAVAVGQYEVFSAMWLDTPAKVQRVEAESVMVPLRGFPPLAGSPAISGNAVRMARNSSLLIGTM